MIRKNDKIYSILKGIAKEYLVTLRFSLYTNHAYADKSLIYISKKRKNKADLLSAFFHELAHVICYRKGHYKIYHTTYKRYTRKIIKTYIYTGLKAEKYVDRMAALIMKRYFPKIRYKPGYDNEDYIKWYKEEFLIIYRKLLKNKIIK